MHYHNPILPGFHPDPSLCRVGEDYYLVTSSFEYFPGVPLFHSRDLLNWTLIGHCLTRRSQLVLDQARFSGGIYAPTIRHHNGRFYMITTNVTHGGNFFVWTDDIRGAWSDPVWVETPGIDPSLLFDDGRVYCLGSGDAQGSQGIFGCEIDLNGRRLSDLTLVWKGTGGAYPEGPHLYQRGEWYYLLISEGGTEHGHMVTVARGRRPLGPFEPCPRNPVLSNRSLLTSVKAVGHADLVEDADGRWWAVCLGIRPVGYPEHHHLGRETFLAPVVWDGQGWPVFGNHGTLALEMEADGLTEPQKSPQWPREDFDEDRLALCWNFLRNPREGAWSLSAKPGHLTLWGSELTLDDQDAVTFLGRRQEHFDVTVLTSILFDPDQDGEEAGLAAFQNHLHHDEIGITGVQGQRSLIFRRRVGSLWKVENEVPCPPGPLVLGIDASPREYHFFWLDPQGQRHELGSGETAHLSTEVGGAFTGVFFALYATGRGRPARQPAHFDWFEYTPGS